MSTSCNRPYNYAGYACTLVQVSGLYSAYMLHCHSAYMNRSLGLYYRLYCMTLFWRGLLSSKTRCW